MSNWQPNSEGLFQVITLLKDSRSPDKSVQWKIQQKLQELQNHPDFNGYLNYIFTSNQFQSILFPQEPQQTQQQSMAIADIRCIAGIMLKNNIKQKFSSFADTMKERIKHDILQCVGDPIPLIRRTVASLVTNIMNSYDGQFSYWPGLLYTLYQYLENTNENVVDGAFHCLLLLCEDFGYRIDPQHRASGSYDSSGNASSIGGNTIGAGSASSSTKNGTAAASVSSNLFERPLNVLIPKFLAFFQSPNPSFRKYAITCLNFFLVDLPPSLLVNMDAFLQGIFRLASDSSPEVRRRVCQALVTLTELRVDFLLPYMNNIVQYIIHANRDENEEVCLEACEFWTVIADTSICEETLKNFLPQIVPLLLHNMQYSDMDSMLIGFEEEDTVPDHSKDIKPFFTPSKLSHVPTGASSQPTKDVAKSISSGTSLSGSDGMTPGSNNEESDSEEENEGGRTSTTETSEWTLRKCSASGLDMLSNVFEDVLLPILLPLLQEKLNDKQNWKARESAILAIGAVAEGCEFSMREHLPQLIPFLSSNLSDKHPLVRNITCWTLSRYSRWLIRQKDDEKFTQVLFGLLGCIGDPNKKVQEASCSALATLEEEAGSRVIPYIGPILNALFSAFERYQARNVVLLYDAIGTLAEAAGPELSKAEYLQLLLPPLIRRWNLLSDDDRSLLPLFQCLASVTSALGPAFQPFALPVFQRCLKIVENALTKQAQSTTRSLDQLDREFLVSSLDLISGLIEGLRETSIEWITGSNLLALLYECMRDPSKPDVLQSVFALVGDLAKYCIAALRPVLNNYLPLLIEHLYPPAYIAVCNNASWAIGEIAVKVGTDIGPFVPAITSKLIEILQRSHLNRHLLENTAITMGRLGFVCPETVAPRLGDFVREWCQVLRGIRDDEEKIQSFWGLCKVIKVNPNGITTHVESFMLVCDAISSWQKSPPKELQETFAEMLHAFKNAIPIQNWEEYFQRFPQQLRQSLQQQYRL